jgi:CDGSH-type Zn-finger protein
MAVSETNPGSAAEADQPEPAAASRREPAAATLVTCPNGPLLLRGDVDILTETGEPVPRLRRTVALCRCGASSIKPYCDGTHKLTGFTTGPTPSGAGPAQDG